jgi:hypothetical protein
VKYLLALSFLLAPVVQAQQPVFHVLAFYSETVERDHVDFAHQAITPPSATTSNSLPPLTGTISTLSISRVMNSFSGWTTNRTRRNNVLLLRNT